MIADVTKTPFDAAAILLVLAAVLGCVNRRFIGLPPLVGLAAMAALASLAEIGIGPPAGRRI